MTNAQKAFSAIALLAIAIAGKSSYDFNQRAKSNKAALMNAELQLIRDKQKTISDEIEKSKRPESELKYLISMRVFEQVSRDSYPKLSVKLGLSFNRVQSTRQAAAVHALRYSDCDFVEWSELSEKSTPGNITMETKCKNGLDFDISETDIKNHLRPASFRR